MLFHGIKRDAAKLEGTGGKGKAAAIQVYELEE